MLLVVAGNIFGDTTFFNIIFNNAIKINVVAYFVA